MEPRSTGANLLGPYGCLIQMVTDGDLALADITINGLRFEYTKQGLAKLQTRDRKPLTRAEVAAIAITSIFLIALMLIVYFSISG